MKRGHVTGYKKERQPANAWYASAEAEVIIRQLEQELAAREAAQARTTQRPEAA